MKVKSRINLMASFLTILILCLSVTYCSTAVAEQIKFHCTQPTERTDHSPLTTVDGYVFRFTQNGVEQIVKSSLCEITVDLLPEPYKVEVAAVAGDRRGEFAEIQLSAPPEKVTDIGITSTFKVK